MAEVVKLLVKPGSCHLPIWKGATRSPQQKKVKQSPGKVKKKVCAETRAVLPRENCAETPVSGSGGSLVAFFDQQLLCMKRVLLGGTVELACMREGSAGFFGIPMAQFHYLGIV